MWRQLTTCRSNSCSKSPAMWRTQSHASSLGSVMPLSREVKSATTFSTITSSPCATSSVNRSPMYPGRSMTSGVAVLGSPPT